MKPHERKHFGLTPSPRSRTTILGLLCFLVATLSHAGGSIGWDEVKTKLAKEDPFLAALIETHFDVNRVGGAARVGHDSNGNSTVSGLEVGTRLPPYEFNAKPKGAKGAYSLYIV